MRYGIVRDIDGLPTAPIQRRRVEAAGCAAVLVEGEPTRQGQRALRKLLAGLRPGDEVVVCDLDALQLSTGELADLLRRFFETEVAIRLVDGSSHDVVLSPAGGVPRVLSLLADHESRWPTRLPSVRRARRKGLTQYQLDHVRDLRRKGQSLRAIGLLFEVTPNELREALGFDAADPAGDA